MSWRLQNRNVANDALTATDDVPGVHTIVSENWNHWPVRSRAAVDDEQEGEVDLREEAAGRRADRHAEVDRQALQRVRAATELRRAGRRGRNHRSRW